MNKLMLVFMIGAPLVIAPSLAGAKGCLKGAAVGGVAGHVAGGHAVVGATAGCVIEHHREKVKDKAVSQQQQQQQQQRPATYPNGVAPSRTTSAPSIPPTAN